MITRDQVKAAIAAIKSAADSEFFFDSLKSPEWIRPLAAEGLFATPPAPVHENELVAFPFWPQSRYLKRMAPIAAQDVLTVILAIPVTENVRVHEDLVDAALGMPAAKAARLAESAAKWAESPYQLLLAEKVGALIEHLANGKENAAALVLARALLSVQPDPRRAPLANDTYSLPPDAQGRIHEWEYGQILEKHIPALIAATGEQGLALLCDLLDAAVAISHRRHEGGEDYSYIWRTAIEDHSLNKEHEHGVRDHLVTAVRDASISMVTEDRAALPRVLATLESRRWKVVHRIALHVLRQFAPENTQLVRERLLDATRAEDLGLFHEFWLLARTGLPSLSPEDQELFLAHMDAKLRHDETESDKEETTEQREDERRQALTWMYRRLSILADVLPPSRVEQLAGLRQQFGPIEHPDFLTYSLGASWVGPSSPKASEDLSEMSVADLTAYLRAWQPEGGRDEPSPEGLNRTLASVVAAAPERYAAGAELFEGLDPTYVRALVSGLQEGLKAKRPFSWEPVLRLCSWAMAQQRDIPGRSENRFDEVDPGWGWTRRAIADLLATGFGSSVGGLPITLRKSAWAVLEPLTSDPDPTPDHEARYGGTNMDPTTLSINTTRGEAMHSVVHYALWVRRHFEQDAGRKERLDRGFDEMPEVRSVLDVHLDPERDPSAAIRSVYGQWFAWLFLLDPTWTKANVKKIFPGDTASAHFLDAAWDAYIIFGGAYDNVFTILHDQYALAIGRLGPESGSHSSLERPDNRLAEHLMVFYWRGRLPLAERGGHLEQFYATASPSLRAHALGFVGHTIRNDDGSPIPDAVQQRLQELIEWRIQQTRILESEARSTEISQFGWWFASQKFPHDWAMAQLLQILPLVDKVEDSGQVVEVLATMADTSPEPVIDALTLMVEGNDRWGGWLEATEPILHAALDSGRAQTRDKAVDLIHLLGAKGYRAFEKLLPTDSA